MGPRVAMIPSLLTVIEITFNFIKSHTCHSQSLLWSLHLYTASNAAACGHRKDQGSEGRMIDTSPSLPHTHIMKHQEGNEFAILGSIKYPYIEKYSLKCTSQKPFATMSRGGNIMFI